MFIFASHVLTWGGMEKKPEITYMKNTWKKILNNTYLADQSM